MIKYEKYNLDNGLTVILHKDPNTPIVAVNTLYDVGARDEDPGKTGFAHLFEHLMFGGSKNIPDFDKPLEDAGGSSNAFTSNDMTNYYNTLPVENLETALWLESDRMNELAFTPKSLEVQRNVVIEEFKQRYLNQPYGDVWMLLRPLAYKKHPYQWATIGKEVAHIENATMEDVKAFFYKHYAPKNAILTVAGNIDIEHTKKLIEKWFNTIPNRDHYERNLPQEPEQKELRKLEVERKVPASAFYWAYKMPARNHPDYYKADLVSDILSRGKSSRLYKKFVKELQYLSEVNAYIMGSFDQGLLVITGKLNEGISQEQMAKALDELILDIITNGIEEHELTKVRNKLKTTKAFTEYNVLNKAMNLSIYELLGDIDLINNELDYYEAITTKQMNAYLKTIFNKDHLSILNVNAI